MPLISDIQLIIDINKIDTVEGNMVKIKDKFFPIGQTYRNEFMNLIRSGEMD